MFALSTWNQLMLLSTTPFTLALIYQLYVRQKNCDNCHFHSRFSIYQSELERTSRSDLASDQTSFIQVSVDSRMQHGKILKNVKIMIQQTNSWSLNIGSHIFCTD